MRELILAQQTYCVKIAFHYFPDDPRQCLCLYRSESVSLLSIKSQNICVFDEPLIKLSFCPETKLEKVTDLTYRLPSRSVIASQTWLGTINRIWGMCLHAFIGSTFSITVATVLICTLLFVCSCCHGSMSWSLHRPSDATRRKFSPVNQKCYWWWAKWL